MTPEAPKMKKRAAKAPSYLELHAGGTSRRVELDSRWLANLLQHMPGEALPKSEMLLRTRAGRTIAGHLLWQGRTVLDAFTNVQVQRILACWMPHWSRRDTWETATMAVRKSANGTATQVESAKPACWMVALPRSGSNHVMHVLAGMANGVSRSMYGHLGKFGEQANATIVRSHALSPCQFDEESLRFTGQIWDQKRQIILLIRDPRDIMISFYEYALVMLKVKITQSQFLHDVDYYLVSGTDIGGMRRSTLAPTSVIQAMRKFMTNWLAMHAGNDAVHLVRFEDLTVNPFSAYVSLASTLGLPNRRPTKKLTELPLARYDRKQRPRGTAQGWEQVRKKYATLIDGVQRELSAEMRLFGYEPESV